MLRLILLAFIATRAVIPMGFMPGALDSTFPFVLCPANAQSAALLALTELALTEGHPHGHEHHENHASHFTDSVCPFSALGANIGVNSIGSNAELHLSIRTPLPGVWDHLLIINTGRQPPVRAPPASRNLI